MRLSTLKDMPFKVGDSIAHFGGRLQCRKCGARKQVAGLHGLYLRFGWPECCGETMEWLTDVQLATGEHDGTHRNHCSRCGRSGHNKRGCSSEGPGPKEDTDGLR